MDGLLDFQSLLNRMHYVQSGDPMVSKDRTFQIVDEAIIVAALGGDAKFTPSNGSVMLRSLNSAQLCQLFDHCYLYYLGDFVARNKLIGIPTLDVWDVFQCLTKMSFPFVISPKVFTSRTVLKVFRI